MKTTNVKSRVIALIALASIGAACAVIRARAQDTPPPEPDRMLFGMAGITRGQIARINVVNIGLTTPPEPDSQPTRVAMAFVDSDGNVLRNSDGQPVRREVDLALGHAAFLQINGNNFIGRDQVRLNFRPWCECSLRRPSRIEQSCPRSR